MWYYVLLAIMIFFVVFYNLSGYENMEARRPDPLEHRIEEIKQSKKKSATTYANSMRDGMLRGFLGGLITGNYEGMVSGAVSYGLINPIFKYLE